MSKNENPKKLSRKIFKIFATCVGPKKYPNYRFSLHYVVFLEEIMVKYTFYKVVGTVEEFVTVVGTEEEFVTVVGTEEEFVTVVGTEEEFVTVVGREEEFVTVVGTEEEFANI